jgi:hypothetical protein
MLAVRTSQMKVLAFACLSLACNPADPPPARDFPTTDALATVPSAPPVSRIPTFGKSGPVDQSGFHPEYVAARNELLRIAEMRDTAALLRTIAPDIKTSFGGDGGLQGFRDHWQLSSPDTEIWAVLTDILIHGGRFSGDDSFTAPWTFTGLPDSLDAFSYLIIRADAVPVYEKPDSTSAVVGMASFDIVKAGPSSEGTDFRSIVLTDGSNGYVAKSKIRSPLDYRAIFERRNNRFVLVALVAGD